MRRVKTFHSYVLILHKNPTQVTGGGGLHQVGIGHMIAWYSQTHASNWIQRIIALWECYKHPQFKLAPTGSHSSEPPRSVSFYEPPFCLSKQKKETEVVTKIGSTLAVLLNVFKLCSNSAPNLKSQTSNTTASITYWKTKSEFQIRETGIFGYSLFEYHTAPSPILISFSFLFLLYFSYFYVEFQCQTSPPILFPTEVKISCQQFLTPAPVGCHQRQHLNTKEHLLTFNLNSQASH